MELLSETDAVTQDDLISIAGAPNVRKAQASDLVSGAAPRWIVEPGSEQELASLLRYANEAGLSVTPRGGGTKLEWGNPSRAAGLVVSLARLDQIVEHAWADLTVTVEAGCSIANLQRKLAEHGQRLAVEPLWPERATVGGVLSTNDAGALRLYHCGLRDLLIGVTLVLADGTIARSGGKVVKNVAGYDLPKLAIGALGTIGVISRATFRVHPIPAAARTLSARRPTFAEGQNLILTILNSNLTHSALQICTGSDCTATVDIRLEGSEVGLSAEESRFQTMAGHASVERTGETAWSARQDLWKSGGGQIAKIAVLPSAVTEHLRALAKLAAERSAAWKAVIQATGIGWIRIEAAPPDAAAILDSLRKKMKQGEGSLVVLRSAGASIDAWGEVGDALTIMLALKRQFDPKGTLNPGRFVGGI